MGACIQCSNKSCYLAFHVTCARRAKLYLHMKQSIPTDPSGATAVGTERSVIFDGSQLKAFCDKHVPTEWRKENRVRIECNLFIKGFTNVFLFIQTDDAIRNAQDYYENTFYDKDWGDSQAKALAGPAAFLNDQSTSTATPKITLT